MSSTAITFAHADLLARLLPPVSYDTEQPRLSVELTVSGKVLDDVQQSASELSLGISPLTCREEMLDDWERFLGLPACPWLDAGSRRARAQLKINLSPGRLDKAWFIWLATSVGYSITIDELDYFQLDWSPMDVTPLGGDGDQFVWVVRGLPSTNGVVQPAYLPGCGLGLEEPRIELFELDYDPMDETPFAVDQVGTLQALFTTLKPAQTQVIFNP